jgi:hypothetical protein
MSETVQQLAKPRPRRPRIHLWTAFEVILIVVFLLYISQPLLVDAAGWVRMLARSMFN